MKILLILAAPFLMDAGDPAIVDAGARGIVCGVNEVDTASVDEDGNHACGGGHDVMYIQTRKEKVVARIKSGHVNKNVQPPTEAEAPTSENVDTWTSVVSDVIPEEAVADDDAVTGQGRCGLNIFTNLSADATNGDARWFLVTWCKKPEYGYPQYLCASIADQVFSGLVDGEPLVDVDLCDEVRELVVAHYIQQRRQPTHFRQEVTMDQSNLFKRQEHTPTSENVGTWTPVVSNVIPEEAVAYDDAVTGRGRCGLDIFDSLSADATNGDARWLLVTWCKKPQYGYPQSLCASIADQVFSGLVDGDPLVGVDLCDEVRELVVAHYIQQRREPTNFRQGVAMDQLLWNKSDEAAAVTKGWGSDEAASENDGATTSGKGDGKGEKNNKRRESKQKQYKKNEEIRGREKEGKRRKEEHKCGRKCRDGKLEK